MGYTPNMGRVIRRLAAMDFNVITTTQTNVNFKKVSTEVSTPAKGNIQPAKGDDLKTIEYDSSKEYYNIYRIAPNTPSLKIKDIIGWNAKRYLVISPENFTPYGYYKSLIEEIL